jgi:hypothetical protein
VHVDPEADAPADNNDNQPPEAPAAGTPLLKQASASPETDNSAAKGKKKQPAADTEHAALADGNDAAKETEVGGEAAAGPPKGMILVEFKKFPFQLHSRLVQ